MVIFMEAIPLRYITIQTTLIQCDITQTYVNSKWAFTRIQHVSAFTGAILKHVNTKTLQRIVGVLFGHGYGWPSYRSKCVA